MTTASVFVSPTATAVIVDDGLRASPRTFRFCLFHPEADAVTV